MPFAPIPVTTEDFVTYLTKNFGTEVNTKNLFQASEHFNCSLATVKKRLKKYVGACMSFKKSRKNRNTKSCSN